MAIIDPLAGGPTILHTKTSTHWLLTGSTASAEGELEKQEKQERDAARVLAAGWRKREAREVEKRECDAKRQKRELEKKEREAAGFTLLYFTLLYFTFPPSCFKDYLSSTLSLSLSRLSLSRSVSEKVALRSPPIITCPISP